MENQIINLLILEDHENHFDKIQEFMTKNKNIANNLSLEIYDKKSSASIVSSYCAYKTASYHLVEYQKNMFQDLFYPIIDSFEDNSLICIIDINWRGDKGKGSLRKGEDRYGLDFCREFLVSRNHKLKEKGKAIIITTVANKGSLNVELDGYSHIIPKKDDNNKFLTDIVLNKYLEEIKDILGLSDGKTKKKAKGPYGGGISSKIIDII